MSIGPYYCVFFGIVLWLVATHLDAKGLEISAFQTLWQVRAVRRVLFAGREDLKGLLERPARFLLKNLA